MAKEADPVRHAAHQTEVNEHSDPSAIEAAIAHTRSRMSETLAAIEDRLSPEHLAAEAMAAVTRATDEVADDVGKVADDTARAAMKDANAAVRELEK
jgi:Protein of unknown function (DUF3618)